MNTFREVKKTKPLCTFTMLIVERQDGNNSYSVFYIFISQIMLKIKKNETSISRVKRVIKYASKLSEGRM